jgi:hypothetical protein|tara:strand:+ start:1157 stop:1294 length:138 start_codon:yes stop_codon:yes gene_type:complete
MRAEKEIVRIAHSLDSTAGLAALLNMAAIQGMQVTNVNRGPAKYV